MHECVHCHQRMEADGIYTINLCPSCEKEEAEEWAEYIRDQEASQPPFPTRCRHGLLVECSAGCMDQLVNAWP